MKAYVTFLLVYLITGLLFAGQDNQENGKKEATFVKEGKAATAQKNNGAESTVKQLEVRQDGKVKARKSKERQMMGSAATSGPAQKIEKKTVREQPTASELQQLTSEQGKPKKRTDK